MTVSNQSKPASALQTRARARKHPKNEADQDSDGPGSDPLLRYVGQRVFAERQRLGLTQEQLSEKAGCAPATVFLVENARRNMTIRSLSLLATALGVEVAELLPCPKVATPSPRASGVSKALAEEVERAQQALCRIEALAHQVDETKGD